MRRKATKKAATRKATTKKATTKKAATKKAATKKAATKKATTKKATTKKATTKKATTRKATTKKATTKKATTKKATTRKTASKKATTKKTATPETPSVSTAQAPIDYGLVGVVDVGSRAIRLAVAEHRVGRTIRRLETVSAPVSIGVDTFSRGRIRAVTTEAVVRALKEFSPVVGAYGLAPKDCRAIATTAVRDAVNREVFLDQVQKRTGFQVSVIEAIEETRLAHQLMRKLLGSELDQGTVMLLGLGAGGTHIVVQRDGEIALAESRSFGIFKLLDGRPLRQALGAARVFLRTVVRSINRLHSLAEVRRITVISAELHRLVESLGRGRRHPWGLSLSPDGFEQVGQHLDALTLNEVAEEVGFEPWLAESARMAFEELRTFAEPCALEHLLFPDCTMLDSLLLDACDPEDGSSSALQTAEGAAWAVARRYVISERHAQQVRKISLEIFDGLLQFTGLCERARLLLSVAAILHDVGIFVSTHEHELHSAYLIEHSEIMGVSSRELARVAMVVRHHRHPFRDIHTEDFGALTSSERLETLKLTAILRIANALDANHHLRVQRVRIHPTAEELQVVVETHAGDRQGFFEVKRAFNSKADLAEEIFGMRLRLVEVLAT